MSQKIIQSFFETDWYKITMGQVAYYQFPLVWAKYQFINRGGTKFPDGFGTALRRYIEEHLDDFTPQMPEVNIMKTKARYTKPTYFEWLSTYKPDPNCLNIVQNGSDLAIDYEGYWHREIHWEVTLMALISGLYYQMMGLKPERGWEEKLLAKGRRLYEAGVYFSDFGTRRRFSGEVQDRVCEMFKQFTPYFVGTSNPYLAMKYGITPQGTYGHEGPMAMQMLGGLLHCNKVWMDAWVKEFGGDLGTALTDTVTTEVFLRDFSIFYSKLFDGTRHDSNNPYGFTDRMLRHYSEFGIPSVSKKVTYSDGLNIDLPIALNERYGKVLQVGAGIGTHLTNDVGHKPLNMVIKMVGIKPDAKSKWYPVVKYSDVFGKNTGDQRTLDYGRYYLGIEP